MKLIESEPAGAQENMDRDVQLLEAMEPALHIYAWKNPSVTYGHFFKVEEHFYKEAVKRYGLDLGKRPTGGGALFHLYDFAFSLTLPAGHPLFSENTLECYRKVNGWVASALSPLFSASMLQSAPASPSQFCMAQPTIYDLVVEGKKIGGAAQRRTRGGVLHQGTISLARPEEALITDVLKNGAFLYSEMLEKSFFLDGSLEALRMKVRAALIKNLV